MTSKLTMLVQSHAGAVHLLPALPDAWDKGIVKGLRCRGGFILNELNWKNGSLHKAEIYSSIGGILHLRTAVPLLLNGRELNQVTHTTSENILLKPQTIKEPLATKYRDWETDRKSTRLNSSHITRSRMPSSA